MLLALALAAMRRNWVCTCGTVKLWYGGLNTAENSQHLTDWYSWTHIVHGFLIYFLLWLALRRLPLSWRWMVGIFGETLWEVIENTPWIIDRYRTGTVSLDYFGDSIVNSLGDIAAMALGFWVASRAPVWVSLVLALVIEVGLALVIRDNLTLNLIMLTVPIEAIRQWQAGG